MVDSTTIAVTYEGHEFQISIHDNYYELFFGESTDSRMSVGYCGPRTNHDDLPQAVKEAMATCPNGPYMWRKCKTYLKVESRCNEDVWNVAGTQELPRANEAKLYLSDLCRAHIPVINELIKAYRLATYDYFAFEISPWDVPHWCIERDGHSKTSTLVSYREWDGKPVIFRSIDLSEKPDVYKLIDASDLRTRISFVATAGEFELLDALNLMERGDYSSAVRRATTAIEVIGEAVAEKAVEAASGKPAADKFLKDTRMRFDERVKRYQKLTGRIAPATLLKTLKETRALRHKVVHGGYRIGPGERGKAQKAVDTCRWLFNWFENDDARRNVREKRIAFRSLGRDLTAGIFCPRITPDGVVLSSISCDDLAT
jgi:ferredoxin